MTADRPLHACPMATMRACCTLALLLLAVVISPVPSRAADPQFPELTGRVVDGAGLLSAEDIAAITADLEALETKTSDQLVLVTLPSLQGFPIEEFGYKLGRHWGIGQQGKDNGVLLIVAPKERKVRIEVGRGLEGTLPDAMAKLIIDNAILPEFRGGDFPAGIKAGLRDITTLLTNAPEAEALRARARDTGPDWAADHADIVAFIIIAIWLIIMIIVLWSIINSIRHGAKGKKGKGWTSSTSSSNNNWSSTSSWSGGGGGFSGGGGSFGGGGASGGW